MPGEGSTSDVPPPARAPADSPARSGRFDTLQPLEVGSFGPVFRGDAPDKFLVSVLQRSIPAVHCADVVDQLTALATRLPRHAAIAAIDSVGVDGPHPYIKWHDRGGDPLDVAIRTYGAAAFADALPRVRVLADGLDRAADAGVWHGALEPSLVLASLDETSIIGTGVWPILEGAEADLPRHAWLAPEVADGERSSPMADQYGLAAVAYLWLFGVPPPPAGRIARERPGQAGIDSSRLAPVFARALAIDPDERFDSCTAFVRELEHVVTAADTPVIVPTRTARVAPEPADVPLPLHPPAADDGAMDVSLHPAEAWTSEASLSSSVDPHEAPVAWRSSAESTRADSDAGSYWRLTVAVTAAVAVGFLAGWMARSWTAVPATPAADTPPLSAPTTNPAPAPLAVPSPTATAGVAPVGATDAAIEPDAPVALGAPGAAGAPVAPVAPSAARLLIRTTPSGAAVTIDGIARGTTPLAVRDLAMGTRVVQVGRPGYRAAERRITLTPDRPSRSLEVTLVPERTAAVPVRPAAPSAGVLVAESRPPGATVLLDGRAVGRTPLALDALAPGRYAVQLNHAGYQRWETTVEIKAGERARVAASLVGGPQPE